MPIFLTDTPESNPALLALTSCEFTTLEDGERSHRWTCEARDVSTLLGALLIMFDGDAIRFTLDGVIALEGTADVGVMLTRLVGQPN